MKRKKKMVSNKLINVFMKCLTFYSSEIKSVLAPADAGFVFGTRSSSIPNQIDLELAELEACSPPMARLSSGSTDVHIQENNRFSFLLPWTDPIHDNQKLTAIVGLPSGIVPETVNFAFDDLDVFYAQSFTLSYNWPDKCLLPDSIFSLECKKNTQFNCQSEYLAYRNKMCTFQRAEGTDGKVQSKMLVDLPFRVQKAAGKHSLSLHAFRTDSSQSVKGSALVKNGKTQKVNKILTTQHYLYYVLVRMTGEEVETVEKVAKKRRVVILDDASLESEYSEYDLS